jgi:subtilisin family serine protease
MAWPCCWAHILPPRNGFVEPHALDSLSTAAGFDMSAVTVYKIAPQLSSEDVTTVDNTGETVKMDELWSIFLLVLPFGTNEQETCNKLQELYPLVRYAHMNWTTHLSGPANDANYATNQASLHATPTIPNTNINVEGAWARTVGKSAIKVGVADTGIRADHADFQFNGTSVVVGGYDAIPFNTVNQWQR